MVVDFRCRRPLFRGRAGEHPRRFAPAGSPVGVERLQRKSTEYKKITISFNRAKKKLRDNLSAAYDFTIIYPI